MKNYPKEMNSKGPVKSKDQIVDELFEVVQAKKKEIAKAEKPNWKTNCSFPFENSSGRVNIQTVSEPKTLIGVMATLVGMSENWYAATGLLGVTEEKFEYAGYSFEDWQSDIQTRLTRVQLTKKKKELDELEARLDKLVSPEKREQMELEAIQNLLSK